MAITQTSTPARQHSDSLTPEVLAGLVERVTFHNSDNGFCVLRAKARGHRDLVTVVGHADIIAAGKWITASGEWVNDHTHGQQFKARFMRTSGRDTLRTWLSAKCSPVQRPAISPPIGGSACKFGVASLASMSPDSA
jgi:hypothetical protein